MPGKYRVSGKRPPEGTVLRTPGWHSGFRVLGFRRGDFSSKSFLDVGAGWGGPTLNWGDRVYGVDPHFGDRRLISARGGAPSRTARGRGVRARVAALPFRENAFDHIFSTKAVGWYPDEIPLGPAFLEMSRVVKPGGDIRLFVVRNDALLAQRMKLLLPHLHAAGIEQQPSLRSAKWPQNDVLVFKKTRHFDPAALRRRLTEAGLLH